jgi:outer membrane protein OmpA-like peptidoglycan-associated protein/osmotically-inducible protein OsmY
MRKYLFRVLIFVAILWAIGAWWYLPQTESSLTKAAQAKLEEAKHQGVFKQVKVEFSGQEASLTGVVATSADKEAAGKIVAEEIRLPRERGEEHNPVIAVHNELIVDPEATDRRPEWLLVTAQPSGQRVDGWVRSPTQVTEFVEKFSAKLPAGGLAKTNIQLHTETTALPPADWEGTLTNIPDFKALLEGKPDKERGLIAISACDGKWATLTATATDAEIAAALTTVGKQKVPATELTDAVASLRAWHSGPSQAELDRMAAEKVAAEKAQAEALAKQRAKAKADAEAKMKLATPGLPAYIGVTAQGKTVGLFGAVPTEAEKALATANAQQTYSGSTIDSSKVQLDAQRTVPTPPSLKLPAAPTEKDKANFIGLATFDGTSKPYAADAFDSEIAQDFPALKFKEGDLSSALLGYRTALAAAGALTKDEPYLAIATDGKSIFLTGEVAEAETKAKLLEKLAAANPGFQVVDKLQVSALVSASPALPNTLDSLPKFTAGASGVAVAKPDQKWRSAVVHSIYFKTGSDRSKDQERALYQMQRIRDLLPQAKFEIVGHTDNVGNADANKKLSQERAQSFVGVATAAGFAADTLASRGAGPAEPIAPNDTPANKALNRRVDVMLK